MTTTISAALKAHMGLARQTIATCWKVTRVDATVLGFTDHDRDIVFVGVTYAAATGYRKSDVSGALDLSVPNLELTGLLESPSITESDLTAGIWDFAAIEVFLLNWADLSQGRIISVTGKLGEVSVDRGQFTAQMRGIAQAYSRVLGQLTSPSCRTTLGSSLCKVDLTPFTVTGALTGVSTTDKRIIFDTSRTEPGPTGGITITSISKANPGHVVLASALDLPDGAAINISGCAGMVQVNGVTTIVNMAADQKSFDLPFDTTSFSTYTGSSGKAIPLGSDSGYFDNGVITFLTGLNAGNIATASMEIQSYTPGQFVLELPMPYDCEVGDTYTLHAGCDYSPFGACRDRFNNLVNFRGEPYLPGVDRLMAVGKQ